LYRKHPQGVNRGFASAGISIHFPRRVEFEAPPPVRCLSQGTEKTFGAAAVLKGFGFDHDPLILHRIANGTNFALA